MSLGGGTLWFPEITNKVSSENMQKNPTSTSHDALGNTFSASICPEVPMVSCGWLQMPAGVGGQIKAPSGLPTVLIFSCR